MSMDREILLLASLFVAALVATVVVVALAGGAVNECSARGGDSVKTTNGWVCARLERV